ncbi:MAG TPA: M20/M25/M40 family metallo-hydrolase [Chthonomonadaceae bacterium]|nr:M20/M25/M40 family metallo-hydrolase [Chthonomonadaceae bacterium]
MIRALARTALAIPLLALGLAVRAQTPSNSGDIVQRIKAEGLDHSQVMATLSYLSDVIGPRLTASPNMKHANEWTMAKMSEWGMQNAHLEAWGPFGRGWSLERFSAQIVSPQDIPLIAYPKAWSTGLKAPVTADVVFIEANSAEDLAKYHGHLHGAIVLNSLVRELPAHFTAPGSRFTDAELEAKANQQPGQQGRRFGGGAPGQPGAAGGAAGGQLALAGQKYRFYLDEGVAMVVEAARGDGGTMFVQSATVPPAAGAQPAAGRGAGSGTAAGAGGAGPAAAQPVGAEQAAPAGGQTPGAAAGARAGRRAAAGARRVSPWDKDAPKNLPQIVVSSEQYNRMVRMIQAGEKLRMNVELSVKFYDSDPMGYNTIAEIPGTDLKDEVVMLGAHMDSWHSGTGATDNGAGCAVVMEAARILRALNVQPRRTIRVGLWSGEEEGLLGSRAYVAQHFATRGPNGELEKKPEYDKFSTYFNLDNGTGKIRGVYLQGNEAERSLFADWLAPFKDMGAATVTIANTGGTDHQSFDGVGLPGFQFIQDTIEYDTRTHHSNQDVFDRAQGDDLKGAAVIMAAFAYNAAMRDEKLPRKPAAAQ